MYWRSGIQGLLADRCVQGRPKVDDSLADWHWSREGGEFYLAVVNVDYDIIASIGHFGALAVVLARKCKRKASMLNVEVSRKLLVRTTPR